MPKLPGISRREAVRVFEKMGYRIVRQSGHVVMSNGEVRLTIPQVVNLGNDRTVTLNELIETIETVLGKKATIDRQPEQPGDVPQTWADVSKAKALFGYEPVSTLKEGIEEFAAWREQEEVDLLS